MNGSLYLEQRRPVKTLRPCRYKNIGRDDSVKKIAVASLVFVLAVTLLGGAAWAWLAYQESLSGNSFTMGTVKIALDDGQGKTISPFNLQDMAPGDSTSKQVVISNAGTLAVFLKLTFVGGGQLGDILKADITSEPAGVNYAGLLKDLLVNDIELAPTESVELTITVGLPLDVDGKYASTVFTGDLLVEAVQARNNGDKEYN